MSRLLLWCNGRARHHRRPFFDSLQRLALRCGVECAENTLEAHRDELAHLPMREDVQLACFHRFERARAGNVGIDAVHYHLRRFARAAAERIDFAPAAVLLLTCAAAFVNASAHETRTENR